MKGEKDPGKELKPPKEEAPRGNGRPVSERPRFMFNIADGGFTGELEKPAGELESVMTTVKPHCSYKYTINPQI